MNVIKVAYIDKYGKISKGSYTFLSKYPVKQFETVIIRLHSDGTKQLGIVEEIDLPEEAALAFGDKIKTIYGARPSRRS